MGIFGLFSKEKKEKLDSGLSKTKDSIFSKLAKTVVGKSKVDDDVLDDLRTWKSKKEDELDLFEKTMKKEYDSKMPVGELANDPIR